MCSHCNWDILPVSWARTGGTSRMLRWAERPIRRSPRESCAPTSCIVRAGRCTARRPTRRDSSSWI
uniref:Uncharacterized protein n=1 Tax=Gorilla gorilla gorilla TaxID=9595 RepID=A0A2I2YES7_GORGO